MAALLVLRPFLTPDLCSSSFINILIIETLFDVRPVCSREHTRGGMPMEPKQCMDPPSRGQLNCTVTLNCIIITDKLSYNCGMFWYLWQWIIFRINIICQKVCDVWLIPITIDIYIANAGATLPLLLLLLWIWTHFILYNCTLAMVIIHLLLTILLPIRYSRFDFQSNKPARSDPGPWVHHDV